MLAVLEYMHQNILSMNNSKFFVGVIMIFLNIGSKYITVKLSDSQEAYLRNYIARELLIFSVVWMGTRDVYIALIMTAVFFVLTQHLFHEESPICVLPHKYRKFHEMIDTNNDGEISQKELDDAMALLTKAKEQESTKEKERVYQYFSQYKIT